MTNQERFQLHVYLGAIQRDMDSNTNNAQWVTAYAERIPLENIPPNPANAAKVFLRFVDGVRSQPLKWMLPRRTIGLRRKAREGAKSAKVNEGMENVIQITFNPS